MSEASSSSPPSTHQLEADFEKPKPFTGHSSRILAACYSPDGKQIATGGHDPSMRTWDSDTGEMVLQFEVPRRGVTSVCFSPDGKRLVSGDSDGGVSIWSTDNGRLIVERVDAHSYVRTVAYSPNGQSIASGDDNGRVRIWHAEDMTPMMEIDKHPRAVQSIAFSPDGLRLATGCKDCKIRIFDVAMGALIVGPVEGHARDVCAVTYSPDGNQIASCSGDCTIRTWDASTGRMLLGPLKGHTAHIQCMAYSPDGKKLLSGSIDNTVCLWDSDTGKLFGGPIRGHDRSIRAVSFAPDGSRFVTGASDGSMRLWDTHMQEILLPELTEDEKERYRLSGPFCGHTNLITAVAYFRDGTCIASASADGSIRIWDTHTGKLLVGPLIAHFWVNSIAISSDGEKLASATQDLRVWDTHTGDMLLGPLRVHRRRPHGNALLCVQFSPDDRFIATSSTHGQVLLYDSQAGTQLRWMGGYDEEDVFWTLSFSPDGSRLAGSGKTTSIYVWDVSSGEMVTGRFQGHTYFVKSLAFSPDGLRIVSGSFDMTVRVWDANTGALILAPLQAHSGRDDRVISVTYSPNGLRICSTYADGTIRLWHATTGDLVLGPLHCHKNGIRSAAFSPDGMHIVTGSDDCTIKFWDAFTGEIIHFPDFDRGYGDPLDSILDFPAAVVPGQALSREQPHGIRLGSLVDLPVAAARDDAIMTLSPAQDYHPTPYSRLLNVFANIFRSSRPRSDEVELEERRHGPFSRARVAYAKGKSLVVVAGGKPPRPQELRDVSDNGSATDTTGQRGDGDQNMVDVQGNSDASTSRGQRTEATNDAALQTRQEGVHVTPSMERSTPYSAARGIRFTADSIESEDSFETYCCACCPSWCTCIHP